MILKRVGGLWIGYAIDRNIFDQWLAKKAWKEGAKITESSELLTLDLDNNWVCKAIAKSYNKTIEIAPKAVIAADGVESRVAKLLYKYRVKEGDFAPIYSWEMSNIKLNEPNFEHIFVGNFSDDGYGYVFPKSRTTANIGVGAVFQTEYMDRKFEKFVNLSIIKEQLRNAKYVNEKSKIAPFGDIRKEWVCGNTVFVGDIANQNIKPFVEGVLPAIICGNFVGENIFEIINGEVDYKLSVMELVPGLKESNSVMDRMYNIFRTRRKDKAVLLLELISNIDERLRVI
jgi:digeranylgeranylglycerophospholipid reductase